MEELPDIEFHNVPGPERWPYGPGWLLPRYPRSVSDVINMAGRQNALAPGGIEMRFVTPSPMTRVYLSFPNWECEVAAYRGDFHHSTHKLEAGKIHCLHLSTPERFAPTRPEALNRGAFDSGVWRLLFNGGMVVFHGIETFGHPLRAPLATEKPRIQWLAYGSSITQANGRGYPFHAAARLRVDVQNKGLSGACHIEKEAADFLARECSWNLATLELGINIRSQVPPEEFGKRARYLVEACLSAKPGRPVVLITIFPNQAGHSITPPPYWEWEKAYNAILRDIVREQASRNVHLFEGSDILDELCCLSTDLVHPSDYGHVRMGENLARLLEPLVRSLSA